MPESTRNPVLMKLRIYYLLLILAVFVTDQVTKKLIVANVRLYDSISVLDSFFNIIHIRNIGGAFGIFSWMSDPVRNIIFIAIPAVALACFIVYLFLFSGEGKMANIALALIIGGACGNFVDRVRLGYVVDFLDFHWLDKYHWPAFNAADSSISVGACLLILDYLIFAWKERKMRINREEEVNVS